MYFEVYKDKADEWRWRLKSANGNVLATPHEGYENKADCLHNLELVKQSADAPIREV